MVPFTSPGPAGGGPPGRTGARALGGKRAGGEKKAERGGEGGPHDGALRRTVNADVTGGLRGSCLQCRHYDGASERFQTARREKWFAADAIFSSCGRSCSPGAAENPNRCTIVRVAGACALCFAARHLFFRRVGARVGRARVFRRPQGGLHAASLAKLPRVSCYAPIRPPPHPRAPSQLATRRARPCAPSPARVRRDAHDRSASTHHRTQSDRVINSRWVRAQPRGAARSDGVSRDEIARREGVSVPRGGALARSKRLAAQFREARSV